MRVINASARLNASGTMPGVRLGSRMASSSEMRQEHMEGRVGTATNRGDNQISKRIASLNQLAVRIAAIKNVSADQKASVAAEVQTEIAALTSLLAKINAEGSSTTSMAATLAFCILRHVPATCPPITSVC